MHNSAGTIRKTWFEVRIFISLSIVIIISLLSFFVFKNDRTCIEIAGGWFGVSGRMSIRYGYFIIALFVLVASLIRIWAGSVLTSRTVMAFKIQDKKLLVTGPYFFVRNPIYSADLIAFTALSLCLRPIGLLIPVLIYFHYFQLIKYEEKKLKSEFGQIYEDYVRTTPALVPRFKQIREIFKSDHGFYINFDGFRHNAQYILFIPGLIVAAYTGKFIHAILIGLPAVIDWAVIHTIIGVSPGVPDAKPEEPKRKRFYSSRVFRDILYAQCWEDPELDRRAFNINSGDTVFSITSGGCNALSFLIDDPAKIICLDLSRYQNYLLSLKINAFKALTYDELLHFLGVNDSETRWQLYKKIEPYLPEEERIYWSNQQKDIKRGIIHCGRYERYMHLLRKVFRILIGKKVINELFMAEGKEELVSLFEKKWDNLRWRYFCRIFLSRTFASMLFDRAFYKYLDPSF